LFSEIKKKAGDNSPAFLKSIYYTLKRY